MFKSVKLGTKLIIGFLLVSFTGAIIGAIGIMNLRTISEADSVLYKRITDPLSNILNMAIAFQKARTEMANAVINTNISSIKEMEKNIGELSDFADKNSLEFEKSLKTEEDKIAFQNWKATKNDYLVDATKYLGLAKSNKIKDAVEILNTTIKKDGEYHLAAVDKLVFLKEKQGKEMSAGNTNTADFAIKTMALVILTGVVFSLVLGIWLSLSISRPMKKITNMIIKITEGDFSHTENVVIKTRDEIGILAGTANRMLEGLKSVVSIFQKMADGDLTVDFTKASEKDELGEALVKMIASLNELLSQVNMAIQQVAAGSNQVSQASQSLSQGATEQASSLEEITSSVTEMSSQTKQNSENAIQMNSLSKISKDNAEQGNSQMKELVMAMSEINRSSDEIKKIVKAIDDIAFQINLLALNANVEAARAGKYGKGFAVVADEVRNLAVRSADAVKETTRMVEGSITNITKGNSLVDVTAKQLSAIVDGASKVADLAEEVATASKEQAQGLDQINTGLGQIDQVTQSNTASAEECASSSEELSSQAQQLKNMISKFRLKAGKISKTSELTNFSPEMLEIIRKEIFKSQEHKPGRLESLERMNDEAKLETKAPLQLLKKMQPHLNPKEVITLDDDNFGKF